MVTENGTSTVQIFTGSKRPHGNKRIKGARLIDPFQSTLNDQRIRFLCGNNNDGKFVENTSSRFEGRLAIRIYESKDGTPTKKAHSGARALANRNSGALTL